MELQMVALKHRILMHMLHSLLVGGSSCSSGAERKFDVQKCVYLIRVMS